MPTSIEQVSLPEELEICHKMQADVFHQELNLFGMQIPDEYDKFSVYLQLLDSNICVETFRIVLPNTSVGLPIEETGFQLNQFDHKVCEMSRLVLLKEKRRKIPFSKIISSACQVAKQHDASILVIAILPRNLHLFIFTYLRGMVSHKHKNHFLIPLSSPPMRKKQ